VAGSGGSGGVVEAGVVPVVAGGVVEGEVEATTGGGAGSGAGPGAGEGSVVDGVDAG